MEQIYLKGVEQNNLKNIDVNIPLGEFVVICGPSGSGKSSLAFETLYAEGQRRYIESLSNYARQFLNKAPKPLISSIENIPPAIAIEQKNMVKTSRSTVGTSTEIIDYLRLLFEKIGTPYCPNHNEPIESDSITSSVDKAITDLEGERGYILAPVTKKDRIAKGKKLLGLLLKEGFLRIYYKKEVIDLNTKTKLPTDDFEILIDRMVFQKAERGRLADSLSLAYSAFEKFNKKTSGRARVVTLNNIELKVSEDNACSKCDYTLPPLSSRLFSFSNPIGACPDCNGFGNQLKLDEKKVVPNPTKTIAEGAIQPFTMASARSDRKELLEYCKKAKIDTHTPWEDLTKKQRKNIWNGTSTFYGIDGFFEYLETKKYKMHVRVLLSRYKSAFTCESCNGARLREEARQVFIEKNNIVDLSALTLEDLLQFFKKIKLTKTQKVTSEEILKQITSRLQFLIDVGVSYLTLDRETRTLSGGEYQRINLANQLGMGLSQTLYVLDEPTVGLHPRDNDRLINILKNLKDLGNTLVVVEHDKDVIDNSDYIIEMGPGSGHLGGEVIYSGQRKGFENFEDSNTAAYIRELNQWRPPRTPRTVDLKTYKYSIYLNGCSGHNLKNVNATFPLRRFVCVTGVSGSGKSSLVSQTLYPAIQKQLTGEEQLGLPYKSVSGVEHIKGVLFIDQKPIGRSSRSNPVTYLKVFDEIRKIMSSLPESQQMGFTPGHFSLNVDGGRCPTCKGEGYEVIDMAFMDDLKILCEDCKGKKYKDEILHIRFKNKNIHEILSLTVSQAMDFFVNYPSIRRPLSFLKEVGLEYIQIGQSANSLSGGESQRLKIAKELNMSKQQSTLYILDEPTTGLHPREVEMLLNVLNKLIDNGGSVIVIEHNMDIIQAADFIIEVGPDGGAKGGEILFAGSPEKLSKNKKCATAPYLNAIFQGSWPTGKGNFSSSSKAKAKNNELS